MDTNQFTMKVWTFLHTINVKIKRRCQLHTLKTVMCQKFVAFR